MSGPRHGLCSKTQPLLALTHVWLTLRELEGALKKMKQKKVPGPDGITNEMLKHIGPGAKRTLLRIYNQSWSTGTVPTIWKEAIIRPIQKREKTSGVLPSTARSVCSAVLESFWRGSSTKGSCVGQGTGTDNRTDIFYRYFTPEPIFCTGIPEYTMLQWIALSLSSYINGHSQEFDFYARFRGFLVALPRAYWRPLAEDLSLFLAPLSGIPYLYLSEKLSVFQLSKRS